MRRRIPVVPFLGPLPLLLTLAYRVQAGGVTWVSPSAGVTYKSGDTIVGQWTADGSFSSPSFSLCTSGSDNSNTPSANCGSAVWPIIEKNGDASLIHLSLPTTTSAGTYYLQMLDPDSGGSASSPTFSLNSGSLVPVSSARFPVDVPATVVPQSAPHQSSVSSSIQPLPDYNDVSRPTPTAAYAVPLSLVGVVLVVAGALGVHHRRKLRQELSQGPRKPGRPSCARASGSYTRFPERRPRGYESSVGSRASTPTASVAESYNGSKHYEDDKRTVEDERRSLYSVASLKRQPVVRRMTREPFHRESQPTSGTYGRRRAGRMAAGAFRAGVSPIPPTLSRFSSARSDASTIRREKAKARLERSDQDVDDGLDAVVNRYFHPSPVPPPLSPRLSPPGRLHTRRSAVEYAGLGYDKPLPKCPRQLYDEVARRVSGQEFTRRRTSGRR
ncbi:uncharacterized protein C8Q71DRAFT_758844 [Rhodofomes roseus]|uniref:Uncharacterized protein n=1 Tax=Rhodofomes roseus TaxID=34475 RepID=A0ABQ8KFS4_9APHY|nr:uncharacterized protein C8Q71DRAFT_758844 [Rhodofomes roseus]KAH9836622.1 hypothetical protein C8Q71DRAFT_758844 [Rhodofomes roseus]